LIDLLPVAGYFIRRGRCASCDAPIGVTSPLIEASAGALMVLSLVVSGVGFGWMIGLSLICLLGLAAMVAGYRTAAVNGR
jgi:leader peptidase (prepilin peptidase)/N-methyltransferase